MKTATEIIECNGPVKVGAFVKIVHQQQFYSIEYKSAQVGHIESIDNGHAVIDWHHGVAPKQTVHTVHIHNKI